MTASKTPRIRRLHGVTFRLQQTGCGDRWVRGQFEVFECDGEWTCGLWGHQCYPPRLMWFGKTPKDAVGKAFEFARGIVRWVSNCTTPEAT